MNRIHSSHFYAGNYIDRLVERRQDQVWLRERWESDAVLLAPVWQSRVLVAPRDDGLHALLIGREGIESSLLSEDRVFLGEFHGTACFAVTLAGEDMPRVQNGEFHDLRAVGGELPRDEAGLLGYARGMMAWRDKHRYCGRCGHPTEGINGGHAVKCRNDACGLMQFPRLDPAIIVLVTDGERALLGRQAAWAAGRYSTIAGYVEMGESIEEAVAREVREETGVIIDAVQYHASQPWPFPSSLMLGFFAHASSTQIDLGDLELEDARWFSREDLRTGRIILPPLQAISFDLIETWYNRDSTRPLRTEPLTRIGALAQTPAKT